MGFAPFSDRLVRGTELIVWAEVHNRRRGTGWSCRANHLALFLECGTQFNADFQTDAIIPVDGDVAACLEVVGTDECPHNAAALGHNAPEFRRTRAPAYNGERDAAELGDPNVI